MKFLYFFKKRHFYFLRYKFIYSLSRKCHFVVIPTVYFSNRFFAFAFCYFRFEIEFFNFKKYGI